MICNCAKNPVFYPLFGWEKMIEPTFFCKLTIILILSSQYSIASFLCNKVKNQLEKSLRLLKKEIFAKTFSCKKIYIHLFGVGVKKICTKSIELLANHLIAKMNEILDFGNSILSGFFPIKITFKKTF